MRGIKETGSVSLDNEPQGMEGIERAEDEFWEESWDEPGPW
jgi:hypothetical protein